MKSVDRPLLVVAASLAVAGFASAATDNFDTAQPGPPPSLWKTGVTGTGAAKWEIVAAPDAPSKPNVLKQLAVTTSTWCVKADERIRDGYVQVKGRAVSGVDDESFGVVVRFQDGNNYYVARANGLEDGRGDVRFYKVVGGVRKALAASPYSPIPPAKWHMLRVEFSGTKFTVMLNGRELFSAIDDTIPAAGAVGVWTRGNSITLFDSFNFGAK